MGSANSEHLSSRIPEAQSHRHHLNTTCGVVEDFSEQRGWQVSHGVTDAETHAVAHRGVWDKRDEGYERNAGK